MIKYEQNPGWKRLSQKEAKKIKKEEERIKKEFLNSSLLKQFRSHPDKLTVDILEQPQQNRPGSLSLSLANFPGLNTSTLERGAFSKLQKLQTIRLPGGGWLTMGGPKGISVQFLYTSKSYRKNSTELQPKLHPDNLTLAKYTDLILEKTYQITIPNKSGELKLIHFRRPSSWSEPQEDILPTYEIIMTVRDMEEASEIFKILVQTSDLGEIILPEPKKVVFVVENTLEGYLENCRKEGSSGDDIFELVIRFTSHGQQRLSDAEKLFEGLLRLDLKEAPLIKPQSLPEKREWAYYSFLPWAKSLTFDEVQALQEVSSSKYKEIHAFLRGNSFYPAGSQDEENIKTMIDHIDQAIKKGFTNQSSLVYRADSNPFLNDIWNKAYAGEQNLTFSDKAYIFTTLDPKIATWWNEIQLHKKGIVMEITIPEGSNAAYVDAERIFRNRGYLELILPRDSIFQVTGTEIISNQKILKATLIKNISKYRNPDPEAEDFRIICAWCGAHIRGPLTSDKPTSHGICRPCLEKEMREDRL